MTSGAACAYGTGVASARADVLASDPCVVPPRYVRMSGTSMATPHVAGICALLVEAIGAEGSVKSRAARVRRAITASARPIPGTAKDDAGSGLVDAAAALSLVRGRARGSA